MNIKLFFPWLFYPKFFIKLIGFTPKYIDSKFIKYDEKMEKLTKFKIWQLLVTNIFSIFLTIVICYFVSIFLNNINRFGDLVILSPLSIIILPLPLFFFIQAYFYWAFFVFSPQGNKYFNTNQ